MRKKFGAHLSILLFLFCNRMLSRHSVARVPFGFLADFLVVPDREQSNLVNQEEVNKKQQSRHPAAEQAEATLEFDSLVNLLVGYTQTALGGLKVRELSPSI